MIRLFDFVFSVLGLLILWPVGLVIYILCLFDTGSPIFIQTRVGRYQRHFKLYKFRTMYKGTKPMPTHMVENKNVTKFGAFLRRTKLDEIPQLINVILGDMSLVGPRPTIPEQKDVIRERKKRNVYRSRPGITGLAQIHKIDTSEPIRQALIDAKMLRNLNIQNYFKYIFATLFGMGFGDRIPDDYENDTEPID